MCKHLPEAFEDRGPRISRRLFALASLGACSLIDTRGILRRNFHRLSLIDPWVRACERHRALCPACRTCASRSNGFPFREATEQTTSPSFANVSSQLVRRGCFQLDSMLKLACSIRRKTFRWPLSMTRTKKYTIKRETRTHRISVCRCQM